MEALLTYEDDRLLPSNDAIISVELALHGDTRGPMSFISKQKIIGAATKNKAEKILGAGYLIKTVSNGLRKHRNRKRIIVVLAF